MKELKIDPEFEQVIPPLTKDEYHQLEENILADGKIMMPIALWGDTIVDGHNRYRIACEHGDIPYTTTQLDFDNRHEAVAWICKNQLGRRNLSDEQRVYLLGKRYAAEKQIDKLRDESGRFVPCGQNDPQGEANERRRTSERIAQEIGKSEKYVRRAEEYANGLDAADEITPGTKNKVLNGELKIPQKDIIFMGKYTKKLPYGYIKEEPESKYRTITYDKEQTRKKIFGGLVGTISMFQAYVLDDFSRNPLMLSDSEMRACVREVWQDVKNFAAYVESELDKADQADLENAQSPDAQES
jgi:hypothetical protein